MKTKITHRTDGTMRIELIGQRYRVGREICEDIPDLPAGIRVNNEGVAVTRDGFRRGVWFYCLYDDPEGYPGNINHKSKRHHGWRGTDNNVATYAHGWRRVVSIQPRKRGVGYVIELSVDLKPEEA